MGREALERAFDDYLRDKGVEAESLAASEREVNEFLDALLEKELDDRVVNNSNIEEGVFCSKAGEIHVWIK